MIAVGEIIYRCEHIKINSRHENTRVVNEAY